MANVPRSSFIPKQVTSATPKKIRHTRVFSIFAFISGALLLISLLLSAGVFIYKRIAQSDLEEQRTTLASARSQFDEQDIAEVRSFNNRIELAHSLLDGHISPSRIFDALETSTKQSVQYTSFAFVRRPSGDVSLDLFGVTDDFAKVALQSLENSEDFILKDATVTEVGISLESGGEATLPVAGGGKQVNFKILANVPASKLLFTPGPSDSQLPVDTFNPLEGATSTEAVETTPLGTSTPPTGVPSAPVTSTSTPVVPSGS